MASSLPCDNNDIQKPEVLLTGLPLSSICDEEFIKLFFEDDENLGESIELKHVYLDATQNSAVIEPKDPNAVDKIIDKQPFEIEGSSVSAQIFSYHVVEVLGPTTVVCDKLEKKLKMFLKIRNRSGGGAIEEFKILKPGKAMVKYVSEEVADRVANSKKLIFDDCELEVRLYHPKNYRSKTVLITGLPDDIDSEYLEMYFEDKLDELKVVPNEVELDEDNQSALLTFNDIDDVVKFLEHGSLEMEGQKIVVKWISNQKKVEVTPHEIHASHTIKVEGPTSVICQNNKSHLMRFFANEQRSGGGPIKYFQFEADGTAHITFENKEDADEIVKKKQFTIKGKTVTAKSCDLNFEDTCMIEVKCNDLTQGKYDSLKIYFNNEKRSGGGNVVDSFVNIGANTAVFKFKSNKDAMRVCERDHSEKDITVKLYKGEFPNSDIKTTKDVHFPESVTTCVMVQDIPKKFSKKTLKLYFENRNRSGGGTVESILDHFKDDCVKYVTFESPEAAAEVAKRNHTLDEHKLAVSLYIQAPFDNTKVLVNCLPEGCSKDSLFFFLEEKSNIKPKKISYHTDLPDVALVTMEDEIDIKALKKACAETVFEGVHLELSRVPYSNIVWVGNLGETTTELSVTLYFESKDGCEGSHVENVVMNHSEQTCLVYFKNYKDVDVILKRKHHIENKEVLIKRYESCLKAPENDSQERTFKKPKPIQVAIDKHMIMFLRQSDYCQVIEEELLKCHTTLVLPSAEKDAVTLECTLTKHDKSAFQLLRDWEKRAMGTFEKCLKPLRVFEIPVLQNIWEKATKDLRSITVNNPNKICVITLKDTCIIKIVGEKDPADLLRQQITSMIDSIMNELAKVEDVIRNLTHLELLLLRYIRYDAHIASTYSEIDRVSIEENHVILEGSSRSVLNAKVEILEKTKGFASSRIENLSKRTVELYKSTATQQLINEKFQKYQIMAVWFTEDDHINVCTLDRKILSDCISIIKDAVKEKEIDVSSKEIPDLNTQTWHSTIDVLLRNDPGKVLITVSPEKKNVKVCATDDIFDKVVNQLEKYILSSTVSSESVDCQYDINLLIQKHHTKEIEAIKSIKDSCVTISFDQNNERITLRCLQPMMPDALRRLTNILSFAEFEQYTVFRQGIGDFIKQEKGKRHFESMETAYPCRIVIQGEDQSSQNSSFMARCEYENRRIDATVCDITELPVEMIISPADENLQPIGGLSKTIVSKGGPTIKQECSQHGGLLDMEVFVSKGGNLKCTYVAHIKSILWTGGENGEDSYLEDSVMQCLLKADRLYEVRSIAIPAIGCGINSYPADVATTSIVNALKRFFMENQYCSIEEVYLCDTESAKVKCFSNALCRVFGSKHVKIAIDDAHADIKQAETIAQDSDFKTDWYN